MKGRPDIAFIARQLFSTHVAIAQSDVAAVNEELFPVEMASMRRANAARRDEFTAGRAAARLAMKTLGIAPTAIAMRTDRAPNWPDEIVGSLSHCERDCIAVVARKTLVRSLGVDIEADTPLAPDLIPEICTARERFWLDSHPEDQRGNLAKLLFSIKESAYKCQYPLTETVIDFSAFEVSLNTDQHRFEAIFTRGIGEFVQGAAIEGQYCVSDGLIVSAAEILGI